MTEDSLTVAILKDIRDGVRDISVRLDQTNVRLDQTNERLGHVENALLELAQQQTFMIRWLKAGAARDRRLERDLIKLEKRVDALEDRKR